MKMLVGVVALAVLVTGLASSAQARTDLDRVQGLARKYAATVNGVPKGLCVCTADSDRIGVLRFFPSPTAGGIVSCYRMTFASDGSLVGEALCLPWLPLAR